MKETFFIKLSVLFMLLLAPSMAMGLGPISLSFGSDAYFGEITYTSASTGSVQMGTNGAITYTGAFSGPSVGSPATFTIALSLALGYGMEVDIACDSTGLMRRSSGSHSLQITDVEFAVGSGNRGSFGTGRSCAGVSQPSPPVVIISLTLGQTIYIGMRINMPTPPTADGDYSTAYPGGQDIVFQIVRY